MRLSEYPYVVVRIGCSRCARTGRYRLARLADRYGSEIILPHLLEMLSTDCPLRERSRVAVFDRCGAFYPDLSGPRPPDTPAELRPKLKVVR